MYHPTESIDLGYASQQHLPRRYESEEEEISESEHGGLDNAFSPVNGATGMSFHLSTEELPNIGVDLEIENRRITRLLPRYLSRSRKPRPLSMDIIKRSSHITFAANSIVFDGDNDDDDALIELPSPGQTSPLQSPIFLQPTVYVPPQKPVPSYVRSIPPLSPTSVYSEFPEEETDVLVAEKVTFVEPISKPSLILINPEQSYFPDVTSFHREQDTSDQGSTSSDSMSDAPEQVAKSQYLLANCDQGGECDHENEEQLMRNRLEQSAVMSQEHRRTALPRPYATIHAVSEVPGVPQPLSPRSRSKTFSGLRSPSLEKGSIFPRFPTKPLRRAPSLLNLTDASIWFSQTHPSECPGDDTRIRSTLMSHTCMSSAQSSPSRTCRTPSPILQNAVPYYSSPTFTRDRSGSVYSNNSAPTPTTYPPRPVRNYTMNYTSSYPSSIRSEAESIHSVEAQKSVHQDDKSNTRRKKSLKRSKSSKLEGKEQSTAKSIVGFMLRGGRKSASWNHRP